MDIQTAVVRAGRTTAVYFWRSVSTPARAGRKLWELMNHKITAITLQKHNHQRVSIYLDGEFAFGLARIVAAWLEVGQEIDDDKIATLRDADSQEVAYQQALNFLSYRVRTEAEVIQNLRQHEVQEAFIEPTLERLRRIGMLDDQRFAQSWVDNRSEFRPRSGRALAFELRRHGVSEPLIEQSLSELDEDNLALQAALKHAHKLSQLDWQDFRRKMFGFLGRRGFNYQVSNEAIQRAWQSLHPADSIMNHTSTESTADDSNE
jgi:regulatory protein